MKLTFTWLSGLMVKNIVAETDYVLPLDNTEIQQIAISHSVCKFYKLLSNEISTGSQGGCSRCEWTVY